VALSDSDLNLKLAVSALFRALGYTIFQEVNLCTYSYQPKYSRKQITDFDVLGVRVDADFDVEIAVAECKSVEVRAMENLLKLSGVKKLFNATKAYFVQKRIDINAREIGRELGIWVLDDQNLSTLMAGVETSEKPYVEMERTVYEARTESNSILKRDLSKLLDYLRYDYWTLPEHRNIINLIRLLDQGSKHLDPNTHAHSVGVHQVATNLALAILRLTGEIARHNIDDLREGTLTRLLGGARERRDREAVFDTVAKLIPNSNLSVSPPFLEGLTELVARFVNASASAASVVACLDHFTRRTLKAEVDKVYGEPEHVFGSRTVKLSRDIIHFMLEHCRIPKALFRNSMNDGDVAKNKKL